MNNIRRHAIGKCGISLLIALAFVLQPLLGGAAQVIDKLSNGKAEDTVDFPAAGTSSVLGISVPFDANVTSAGLSLMAGPHTTAGEDYPVAPKLVVGGDGDVDWAFEGTGYGAMGHQTILSDGSSKTGVNVTRPESNTSASIRLPKDATAISALLDIDGLAGYDLWDTKKITMTNQGDIGVGVDGLGDINGDGFEDLGATMQIAPMGNQPKVMIWFGEYGGFGDKPDISFNLGGGGRKIHGIGDVNGDGLDDFMIGTGIYFGGQTVNSTPDVALTGLGKGNNFGSSVSNVGDINGDGVDDIIVGEAGDGVGYYGAAYIYYGDKNMDGTTDKVYDNPTGLKGDGFGDSVTSAGDLNNDTYDDIAISAMWAGPSNEGLVYVYLGGATWDNSSDLTIHGDLDGGSWPKFGNSISGGGDLNVDGYDDLVVAAFNDDKNGTDAGKVYVFYGGNPMDATKDLVMFGAGAQAKFGNNLDLAKDLNGDKIPDIIATSGPGMGGGFTAYVRVFFGGKGMDNVTDWSAKQDDSTYFYATSAADAGDINGMGRGCVVIGAPTMFMMGTASGRIYLYNVVPMDPAESMVQLDNQKVWNHTGLLKGQMADLDFTAAVNAALKNATIDSTDAYGNKIARSVLNITCPKGVLNITNLSIQYSYEATSPDLAKDINDHLAGTTGPGNVTVPINITVSSAGKLTVKKINVQFTPNAPPVAFIDSITPDPVRVGKNISFKGHGTDTDGTIQAYRWASDKLGLLSLVKDPTLSNLTIGTHNISFQVMDNKGRWSAPVYDHVVVLKLNVVPHVTILKPTNGQDVGGIYNVTGTAQDLDPDPLSVWVRIDQGLWTKAEGNLSWHYLWHTKAVADGVHTISARAWDTYDNSTTVNVTAKVNNTLVGDKLIDFELTAPKGTYAKVGTVVTYDFTVKNIGNLADTYTLSAQTDHSLNVDLSPSILARDPGKASIVKARMVVPATAGKGIEVLRLTAASTQNKTLSRTAEVSTNIMIEDIVAGLEVTAPGPRSGIPGSKVDLVFVVRNVGTVTDDFAVTATTYHGWAVELPDINPDKVLKNISVNGTTKVTVRVTVPVGAVGPVQEGVQLNASSKYDTTKTASGLSFIQVGKLSVKVTVPDNRTVTKEGMLSYEFTVINTGDFDAAFTVTATSANGWTVQIDLTEVTVAKGASTKVTVTVTVPKGTKSGTKDVLTLVVTAKANPDVKVEGKVTTTVKGKTGTSQPFSMILLVLAVVAIAAVVGIVAAALHFRKKGRKEVTPEPAEENGTKEVEPPSEHEAGTPKDAGPEVPKEGPEK